MSYLDKLLHLGGGASSGLASARPVATGSGNTYYCDDVPIIYVDDPAAIAWKQYAMGGRTYAPGVASGWTVVGSMGLTQFADALLATTQSVVANVALKPIPSFTGGLWVAELAWNQSGSSNVPQFPLGGPIVTTGTSSGSSLGYCIDRYMQGPGGWEAKQVTIGTNTQSVLRQVANTNYATDGVSPMRARLFNDGVTLFYQFSSNGVFWRNFWQATLPASITQYGFMAGSAPNSEYCDMLVLGSRAYAPLSVAVASANASGGLLTVVTQTPHGLATGMPVSLRGVTTTPGSVNGIFDGNAAAFGNPPLPIVTNPTTFTVNTGGANATYVSGGTVYSLSQ